MCPQNVEKPLFLTTLSPGSSSLSMKKSWLGLDMWHQILGSKKRTIRKVMKAGGEGGGGAKNHARSSDLKENKH